ncbi:DUF4231 domain-containing protein [Chitinibacter bivalviorum]|uniref:DUF4231 domain-containing protein n=1 Tax=Chitinibacter bivalviorum TaxID=2739434 RepID=A0A7H9BFF2_9NEIS|nr:DUF4231 domain-containing protein [Chitinibacter bivalviorum]QLG87433.1 DUF4231 domain-containing protein [Chitinibacter bivalviorum]
MDNEIIAQILQQHPNMNVRFLLSKMIKFQQYCERKSRRLKRSTYFFKFSMLILATISTIVLGLDAAGLQPYAKNIALVLGALITLLGGIASFLNIEEYWMRNNAIHLRLKALRDRLIYLTADLQAIEENILQSIINDYQAITESNINYWYDAIAERNAT